MTAEQYLKDKHAWHTDDPIDRILKHDETLSMDKVQGHFNNKRREETDTNKNNNIQVCDTQEHTINIVPNNRKLTESSKQTVSDNIWTNMMITSTLKHSMAGPAGDQTDLWINKS